MRKIKKKIYTDFRIKKAILGWFENKIIFILYLDNYKTLRQ